MRHKYQILWENVDSDNTGIRSSYTHDNCGKKNVKISSCISWVIGINKKKQTIYRIRPLFLSYGSGLTSQTLLVVVFVAVLSLKLAFLVRTQNTKSNNEVHEKV